MSCELELFRSSFGRLMRSWVCCSGPAGLWNFHQLHLYISKLCVRFCWSLHCNSIDWFSVTATCSFLNYPANCVLISNVFSSTLLIVWFIFLFLNGMAACLVHWCVCVCASFLCRYHALTLMYAPYSILSNCKYLDTCICETLEIEIVEAAARTHAGCFI